MDTSKAILFAVVGPPGTGKNTLMNRVLGKDEHLTQLVTATTRERRPTEREGRDHWFVSMDQFRQMIAENALLEWQEVHPDTFYGVLRNSVETALADNQNLIADIDVLGATYIRSCYPENVVLIFIKSPSIESLPERMRKRGESEASIEKRMARVAMELSYAPVADYIVVNDELEEAVGQFQAIIENEIAQHRSGQQATRHYAHHVVTLPIYEDIILCRPDPPHYLSATVTSRQQTPHQAALETLSRALCMSTSPEDLLRLKPNQGSFISPLYVDVRVDGNIKHITFTYAYLLPHRIEPGAGWRWRSIEESDLPEQVRQALETRRQTSH